MSRFVKRGLLISDFNIENLSAYLTNSEIAFQFEMEVAPFSQVAQVMMEAGQPCWKRELDFVLIWSLPEAVLESFQACLSGVPVDWEAMLSEVDDFCERIALAASRSKTTFVAMWVVPTIHSRHGFLDLSPSLGVTRALMRANLRLLERMDQIPNVFVLNTSKWIELAGEKAFNPGLWYSGKIPFSNNVFKSAVQDVVAALRGITGRARKLIVLDLDDTLWGGIVGEIGWQQVIIGGHDPVGEALADFQRELKALARRGIVLAIVSKNEESVALEAIAKHPEMVLRQDDFAGWRINWKDKAQNIIELAAELNLGLDSVVFLDDSYTERDRVRQALPEVLVPEWPIDKRMYPHALRSLDCFDQPNLTEEDRRRSEMYVTERKRTVLQGQATSMDDWLQTLSLKVRIEPLGAANLTRATQLLNKTNQVNLSTRRLTESEFSRWASEEDHRVWVVHVSDRFGDSGLTGILSVAIEGNHGRIVDFILSCRAIGRKIEETMLHMAAEWAREAGMAHLVADHLPTAKNAPCLAFFKNSGFKARPGGRFVWDATSRYPSHSAIGLEGNDSITSVKTKANSFVKTRE